MRVGNVKEIVFSKDPKQMNWLREDFPYAEVKCPPEFSAEVQNEKNGDVLTTKIVVSYNGAHPYFTNAGSIGVSFPLQDRYTDSVTCRDYRCHAHVFCGENTSYIMALRMGGAAPHMGMVLTKGSLSAYSVERDLKLQSNDRGCFWLHPVRTGICAGRYNEAGVESISASGTRRFPGEIKSIFPGDSGGCGAVCDLSGRDE